MAHKDTVMPDDTVTTSWKRVTDKVKTSSGQSLHASLAATSGITRRHNSYPDSLSLGSDAASASSPTHAKPAAQASPTDHNGEANCQAARLATWEDEGGTTVFDE